MGKRQPAPPQRVVDMLFGRRVKRAGRLIENQNRGVTYECAGDLQSLLLPSTEIAPVLINGCLITEWPAENFVVDAGIPRCGDQYIVGNGGVPQGNVFTHCCGEESDILVRERDSTSPGISFRGRPSNRISPDQGW